MFFGDVIVSCMTAGLGFKMVGVTIEVILPIAIVLRWSNYYCNTIAIVVILLRYYCDSIAVNDFIVL